MTNLAYEATNSDVEKPLSNTVEKFKCRRCKKVIERQQKIPVKKDRYGMTTMGCPNCMATVFTLVNEASNG